MSHYSLQTTTTHYAPLLLKLNTNIYACLIMFNNIYPYPIPSTSIYCTYIHYYLSNPIQYQQPLSTMLFTLVRYHPLQPVNCPPKPTTIYILFSSSLQKSRLGPFVTLNSFVFVKRFLTKKLFLFFLLSCFVYYCPQLSTTVHCYLLVSITDWVVMCNSYY